MAKNNTSSLVKLEQNFRALIIEQCKFCQFDKYLAENPNFAFPVITTELLNSELGHITIPGLFGGFAYFVEEIGGEFVLYAEQSSRMDHDSGAYKYFEIIVDGSKKLEGEEREKVAQKFLELAKKARKKHVVKLIDRYGYDAEDVERMRSETIARVEKMGWKDAVRIVKKFDDPIDIEYAYEWAEKIDGEWIEAVYIEAILD